LKSKAITERNNANTITGFGRETGDY